MLHADGHIKYAIMIRELDSHADQNITKISLTIETVTECNFVGSQSLIVMAATSRPAYTSIVGTLPNTWPHCKCELVSSPS